MVRRTPTEYAGERHQQEEHVVAESPAKYGGDQADAGRTTRVERTRQPVEARKGSRR